MNRLIRSASALLAAAALCVLAAPQHAAAQACGGTAMTILNNTPCTVSVSFVPATLPPVLTLAPYAVGTVNVVPGTVYSPVSVAGVVYPFTPTPPPLPPCPQFAAINFGVAIGCCADMLFDPTSCTIWINPTVFPPPCQP